MKARLPFILLTDPLRETVVRRVLRGKARWAIATTRADLHRALPKADILITLVRDPVDAATLNRGAKLSIVGNHAVGLDNIDLKACRARGIRVVNTPDVLTRSTAELGLALLLAAARRIPEGEAVCRRGGAWRWEVNLLLGQELKGRMAVIVGPGRIGRETARLYRAIGLKTVFIGSADSAPAIRRKLQTADVISIHAPLTFKTRHWLDSRKLALLKPSAIVINTARGPLIDEKALVVALRKRRIFAAGLDVFENEPRLSRELRSLPNVVLLPHIGSATETARDAMTEAVLTGVLGIWSGKAPWNEVKLGQ